MACTVTQADLGPLFADVDADLADAIIAQATLIVLGPAASQAAFEAAYLACGVDPCAQIVLLAQHLLSVLPGSGAEGVKDVTSERVGDVAVTYSSANSSSSMWGSSPFGLLYQLGLSRFEKCRAGRRTLPFSVGPSNAA